MFLESLFDPISFLPPHQYAGKWEYSFEVSLVTTTTPAPNPRIAHLARSSSSAV